MSLVLLGAAAVAGFMGGGIVYDEVRPPFCAQLSCTDAELARASRNRFLSKLGGAVAAVVALRMVR